MRYLTKNNINSYLIDNYGYNKHDTSKLLKASRETGEQYKVTPLEMFFFMIEQKPINKLYTHSYGFNTSLGREVRNTFKNYYNN
tara:strand:+ start:134 stop:385 length:252 start_codon:yes stop_codon:yes gene_type:complete